jgi:hypothetical protein
MKLLNIAFNRVFWEWRVVGGPVNYVNILLGFQIGQVGGISFNPAGKTAQNLFKIQAKILVFRTGHS